MFISPFSQQMCASVPNPWNERAKSTQIWSRWTEVHVPFCSPCRGSAAENSGLNKTTWGLKSKRASQQKTWCRALILGSTGTRRLFVTGKFQCWVLLQQALSPVLAKIKEQCSQCKQRNQQKLTL